MSSRGGATPQQRLGWVLIAVITLAVLLSWAPSLTAGLGDNHEGRILARHALHVANAQDDGLAASGWLSDWSPYRGDDGSRGSYSHHPPLMNLVYYAAGTVLPGGLDTSLRVVAYLFGAAMLPIGAALLRRLGFGWPAVVLATAAVAVTPLFWVYGRLHANVTLLLAMLLVVVRLGEDREVGRGELAGAAVLSAVAILGGWLGMATAALAGLWLLARRGLDRVTVAVGAAMAAAAGLVAAYVVGMTGSSGVADQVQIRTGGQSDVGAAEFAERMRRWFTELLPAWWRWLVAPVAVVAGLADRRGRAIVALLGLVALVYVVGLPDGAFVHDYWIFPVLLPLWVGLGAALDRLLARVPSPRSEQVAALGAAAVLVVGGAGLVLSGVPHDYVRGPEQAGTLVRDVGPGPDQQVAWRTDGLPAPRWLSLYWDLPPGHLDAEGLEGLAADDRVLVRLDRVPDWLGEEADVTAAAVGIDGDYAVVEVGALRGR